MTHVNSITIVNADPQGFKECGYCDLSLPSSCYYLGPMVLLDAVVRPNNPEKTVDVSTDDTIRRTFDTQGFRVKDDRILGVRILPTKDHPDPMSYFLGGYEHSNSVIVPDDIKWGELFAWCRKLEDMCQTELHPIAAAPRNDIEEFLRVMLERRSKQ